MAFGTVFGVSASSLYIVIAWNPMNEKHTTVAPAMTARQQQIRQDDERTEEDGLEDDEHSVDVRRALDASSWSAVTIAT